MIRSTLVAGVLAAAVGLTACGGSSSNKATGKVASLSGNGSSGQSKTTPTTMSPTQIKDAVLKYTACLRKNGVKIADPTFGPDGRPEFNTNGSNGANGFRAFRDDPSFRKAREACQKYANAFRQDFGFGNLTPAQQKQLRTGLLAFAKCMRSKGVNFPDPTFDANGRPQFGNGPNGRGFGRGFGDKASPATQKAVQACQSQLAGAFPGGRGGLFFGGGRRGAGGTTPQR